MAWLQNAYADEPDMHARVYQKSYMWRFYRVDLAITMGRPKATKEYTTEQLEARGIVGYYGKKYIHPILEHKP